MRMMPLEIVGANKGESCLRNGLGQIQSILFSASCILLGLLGSLIHNPALISAASLAIAWIGITGSPARCLYLLFMCLPANQTLVIFGTELTTLLVFIYIIKIFSLNDIISPKAVVAALTVFIFELLHIVVYNGKLDLSVVKWFLAAFLMFQVLVKRPRDYRHDEAIAYFCLGSTLFALVVLIANFGISLDSTSRQHLLIASSLDVNTYSMYCAVAAVVMANELLSKNYGKAERILFILGIAVVLLGGLMSLSKAFVIIMASIAFLYALALAKKPNLLFGAILVVIGLSFLAINTPQIHSIYMSYQERFLSGFDSASDFTTGRSDLLAEYLRYLIDKDNFEIVLFGAGLFEYTSVFNLGLRPHNSLLELISAWGITGTVSFIVLTVCCFLPSKKIKDPLKRRKIVSIYPFLCLALFMLTITLFYQYYTLIYITICLFEIQDSLNSDGFKKELVRAN